MPNAIAKKHILDWAIWCLFAALLLGTMYVHEPWFDEAQAWLIARDAPLKDILWVLPHYEGHPPFWHLLLAMVAKLGIGWEWGLRAVGAVFSIASAYLIIFKAPFPRWIRLALPFTYFLFYQYGVIVRPYSVMVFLMCLLAVYFPQKDRRPGVFIGLLAALCACHLFGIAMAGGIVVAWLWEIKEGHSWKQFLGLLVKDKRFYWMLGLLGWALLLMWMMFPYANTFAADLPRQAPWWQNILYVLLILPADLFVTNVYGMSRILADCIFLPDSLLSGVLGGCIVWGLVYVFLPRNYGKYLFIPYLFLIPLFIYYASRHHIGLMFLVMLWAFWVGYAAQAPVPDISPRLKKKASFLGICMLICCISWSVCGAYWDFRYPVFEGKKLMQFLQEHDLENARIFTEWLLTRPGDWGASAKLTQEREDTNYNGLGVNINMYARRNRVANLNGGGPITYMTHVQASPQQNEQHFKLWREGGIPDLVVGDIVWDHVFPEQPDLCKQYIPVYSIRVYNLWKYDWPIFWNYLIFAHKDLMAKHGLRRIDVPSLKIKD